jgi:hypothetical protein
MAFHKNQPDANQTPIYQAYHSLSFIVYSVFSSQSILHRFHSSLSTCHFLEAPWNIANTSRPRYSKYFTTIPWLFPATPFQNIQQSTNLDQALLLPSCSPKGPTDVPAPLLHYIPSFQILISPPQFPNRPREFNQPATSDNLNTILRRRLEWEEKSGPNKGWIRYSKSGHSNKMPSF